MKCYSCKYYDMKSNYCIVFRRKIREYVRVCGFFKLSYGELDEFIGKEV